MTRSRHRYSLKERPMVMLGDLDILIDRFTRHQQAVGRAPGTMARYRYTFLLFGRFLTAQDPRS